MHDQPTSRLSQGAARPPSRGYAVANTMAALERLSARPLSTTELAASIGVDPRSARGLLQRLMAEGYVTQAGGHRRRYHLTLRLLALATTAEVNITVLTVVKQRIALLAGTITTPVHVWVPRGPSVVPIWGPSSIRDGVDKQLPVGAEAAAHILLGNDATSPVATAVTVPAVAVTERGRAVAAITLSAGATEADVSALRVAGNDLSV